MFGPPGWVSQAYLGPAGAFQVSRCEMVGEKTLSGIHLETVIGKRPFWGRASSSNKNDTS